MQHTRLAGTNSDLFLVYREPDFTAIESRTSAFVQRLFDFGKKISPTSFATLMDSGVEFVAVDNPHANKLTVQIKADV